MNKKIAALVLLLSFVFAGAAFAVEAKPVVKASNGTFVSYSPADTTKNTPASLVVKVGSKEKTFLIDAKTVFEGKDKKPVDASVLKSGQKVNVRFTSDKKVLTAIRVLLK